MMNAKACVETHAPSARQGRGAMRRAASVFLLLDWCAFWLAATLHPCCKLLLAASHSAAAATISPSASIDLQGDAGHHAPDSSELCRDSTVVAGTASGTVAHSTGGGQPAQAYPASVIHEGYAVRRAIYASPSSTPPLPPPRPLPFHLRTSRLLL